MAETKVRPESESLITDINIPPPSLSPSKSIRPSITKTEDIPVQSSSSSSSLSSPPTSSSDFQLRSSEIQSSNESQETKNWLAVIPDTDRVQDSVMGAIDNTRKGFIRFGKSLKSGSDFKQAVADALAGEYNPVVYQEKIQKLIASDKVVVFAWSVSPASQKAIQLLKSIDADIKVINLDEPWDEGNKLRAELGRLVGRSSVPAIFIEKEYIGGCYDGPTVDAPGLIPLAFQGTLRSKLIKARAIEKNFNIDL
jgi:glutaredoxin 3